MDARAWNERYAAEPELWGEANPTVREAVSDLTPGRSVDLACGDGRHAVWLADSGWGVQAVDFSETAIEQARRRRSADRVDWFVDDVLTWEPPQKPVDLVLVAYLHLTGLRTLLERAQTWLAPGGRLVYLGHARENLDHGVGGPQDRDVLPTVEQLAAATSAMRVRRLAHLDRETDAGTAVDVLAVASPWPTTR